MSASLEAGKPVPGPRLHAVVRGRSREPRTTCWRRCGTRRARGLLSGADTPSHSTRRRRQFGCSPSGPGSIAEGAGGSRPRGRALRARSGRGSKIVCIVSGGNIDTARLATILRGPRHRPRNTPKGPRRRWLRRRGRRRPSGRTASTAATRTTRGPKAMQARGNGDERPPPSSQSSSTSVTRKIDSGHRHRDRRAPRRCEGDSMCGASASLFFSRHRNR